MILTSLLLNILCFVCLFKHFFIVIIQNYSWTQATAIFIHTFCSSAKLLKGFRGHTHWVNSIDYSAHSDDQLICSGSIDKTVRVWNMETKKQIQLFNGHSGYMYCVKFSQYHYHNHCNHVICSSSDDQTIRFWDIKNSQQLEKFNVHGIEFSPFMGGRYLCSESWDKTICLWDIETFKSLHVFNGHEGRVWCVDISPLQSNNNNNDNNKMNNIGVIGGNGYTVCSGSFDNTIRIWILKQPNNSMYSKDMNIGL
ncbi:WD-40 repeat protein [Reticulomyxa filosa]|uniref:WD-40 repeat protein n=1 Tax=Reticulomyxa filosa TaxID=46433 RepID=X6PFD8_RETFI|nr:WD-40 repeat protein [Reticulomyxa filosa]|eukprot:ETO36901.1 WD-40 repeat protein [Reticulomyxa filosa]